MPIRLPKAKSTNKFVYEKIRLVSFYWLPSRRQPAAVPIVSRSPPGQPETPEQPGGDDNGEPDTPAPGGNGRYLVLFTLRARTIPGVCGRN